MAKVIINTDIGGDFDDLLALVLALHSPEIEIQGVVTTKEHIRDKALFARKILNVAGRPDIPVFYYGERAHAPEQSLQHGYMAVYDYGLLTEEERAKNDGEAGISPDAIPFIIRTVINNPGEITLVSLAPNTPFAAALAAEPSLADKVKDAYAMGMALDTEQNRKTAQEHNYQKNRSAFKALLESGIPVHVLPRDLTHTVFLSPDVLAKKAENDPFHYLINKLGNRFLTYMKRTAFRLADPITVGALLFPEWYKSQPATVNTYSRGRTLLAPQLQGTPTNVQVYTRFDEEHFHQKLCERL